MAWSFSVSEALPDNRTSVLERTSASAEIISTASELSLKTAGAAGNGTGWLIPANALSTNRLVTLKAHGDYLNNVASSNFILKMVLRDGSGTSTVLWQTSTAIGANVSTRRQPWVLEAGLAALGSASSQIGWAKLALTRPLFGAPTSGIGGMNFEMINGDESGGVVADDAATSMDMSAGDRYLDITVTPSTSSASLAWRLKYATLMLT